jgi:hypothetical protein
VCACAILTKRARRRWTPGGEKAGCRAAVRYQRRKGATGTHPTGRWWASGSGSTDGSVREITHHDDKGINFLSGLLLPRRAAAAPPELCGLVARKKVIMSTTLDGQPATTATIRPASGMANGRDYYANGNVSEEYEYSQRCQNGPPCAATAGQAYAGAVQRI